MLRTKAWLLSYQECISNFIDRAIALLKYVFKSIRAVVKSKQKISLYLRIGYLVQTLISQSISLYARISMPQTPINSLFKFHLMCKPTVGVHLE